MKFNPLLTGCTLCLMLIVRPVEMRGEEILPKHMTPAAVKSIERGLAYLAKQQTAGGSFQTTQDGWPTGIPPVVVLMLTRFAKRPNMF